MIRNIIVILKNSRKCIVQLNCFIGNTYVFNEEGPLNKMVALLKILRDEAEVLMVDPQSILQAQLW